MSHGALCLLEVSLTGRGLKKIQGTAPGPVLWTVDRAHGISQVDCSQAQSTVSAYKLGRGMLGVSEAVLLLWKPLRSHHSSSSHRDRLSNNHHNLVGLNCISLAQASKLL